MWTKGPWKFTGFRKASNFAEHTAVVQAEHCVLVSVRGGIKDNKDVAEANARLIAAAPALYEALDDVPLPSTMGGWSEFLPRFYNWYEGKRRAALTSAKE